jgi:hypothetical protein
MDECSIAAGIYGHEISTILIGKQATVADNSSEKISGTAAAVFGLAGMGLFPAELLNNPRRRARSKNL